MSAGNVQLHKISVMNCPECASIPDHLSDQIYSARRADSVFPADRSRTEKNTKRAARRPISEVADLDQFSRRRIELLIYRDLEVDFVSPCVGFGGKRKDAEKRQGRW